MYKPHCPRKSGVSDVAPQGELGAGGPGVSAEAAEHNLGGLGADNEQAQHPSAPVLVQDHTQQAQDEAQRRCQEESQPAKGCDGGASARPEEQQAGVSD